MGDDAAEWHEWVMRVDIPSEEGGVTGGKSCADRWAAGVRAALRRVSRGV